MGKHPLGKSLSWFLSSVRRLCQLFSDGGGTDFGFNINVGGRGSESEGEGVDNNTIAARIQNAFSKVSGRGYSIYNFEFGYNKYDSFGLTISFSSQGNNESGVVLGTIWEHIPELDENKTDYSKIEKLSVGLGAFELSTDFKKEFN